MYSQSANKKGSNQGTHQMSHGNAHSANHANGFMNTQTMHAPQHQQQHWMAPAYSSQQQAFEYGTTPFFNPSMMFGPGQNPAQFSQVPASSWQPQGAVSSASWGPPTSITSSGSWNNSGAAFSAGGNYM